MGNFAKQNSLDVHCNLKTLQSIFLFCTYTGVNILSNGNTRKKDNVCKITMRREKEKEKETADQRIVKSPLTPRSCRGRS